jgi:hypothetical protein
MCVVSREAEETESAGGSFVQQQGGNQEQQGSRLLRWGFTLNLMFGVM